MGERMPNVNKTPGLIPKSKRQKVSGIHCSNKGINATCPLCVFLNFTVLPFDRVPGTVCIESECLPSFRSYHKVFTHPCSFL